jgi:CRP-like cAMP-binding protein
MNTINHHLQKFYQTFWPDISEEEFRQVSEKYTLISWKKGDVILKPGEVCNWTALVNTGIVRYYHLVDGKEHVGQIFSPGMIVSDYVSYVQEEPSRLYIDVIQDCELSVLKRADSKNLMTIIPSFVHMVLNYLNMIYISNFERYSSLLLDSAETRYLKLFKSRPEVIKQVPIYMIASYLGITPEALSRIRSKISHTGN